METITKKTRTRLSPEKRKHQLLDFALDVFARRGIGRAGHADIADMANVSVATVFNYFPTREELVIQVLAQVEQRFDDILTLCFQQTELSTREKVSLLMHRLIEAVLDEKEWLKVWFEWSTSVREDIWPRYVSGNHRTLETLSKALDNARETGEAPTINAEDTARLLHGVCYVLYLEANTNPDHERLVAQAERYLAILWPEQV
ncbi:TetR/AcrR family transcriptional regulator [Thaumasiovibrio sp. DFM-14]|uniref:TetR/AcrR family transcriptional regulator n=1 Tax=Thaumasiovibrio sp. DFM-14 TaxID=3384792 RepID=UPI0039A119C6